MINVILKPLLIFHPIITHIPATTDIAEMSLEPAQNEIVIPSNPLFQAQLPLVQEEIAIQIDTTVENEHHA